MSTFEPSKFQINYPLFISLLLIRPAFAPDVTDSKYIGCLCLNPIRRLFNRHKITFLVHHDWHQIKSSSFHVIPVSFCCYSDVQFIAFFEVHNEHCVQQLPAIIDLSSRIS